MGVGSVKPRAATPRSRLGSSLKLEKLIWMTRVLSEGAGHAPGAGSRHRSNDPAGILNGGLSRRGRRWAMKPDEKPLQPSLAVTAGAQHVTSRAVCQGGTLYGLEVCNLPGREEIPAAEIPCGSRRRRCAQIGTAVPLRRRHLT